MKNRNLSLLLAGVLAAGVLAAGCGQSASNGGTAETAQSTAQEETEAQEEEAAQEEAQAQDEETTDAETTAQSDDADAQAESGEVRTITVATSANPRPYTYQDEDGNLTGYNIELTQELFALLPQYELVIEATEFDSCLTGLSAGRYQIVANNLGYKDERAELYIYQGPLNRADNAIAYKSGKTVNSLEDIKEWKTEAEPQIAETGYLENYFDTHDGFDKNNIQYTEKQPAQQYQDLEDGTVDYLLSSVVSFDAYTDEFGITDLEYYVLSEEEAKDLKTGLKLRDVYYCLNTDETQLAEDLTEAMKEYKESGAWTELSNKWYGTDLSPSIEEIGYWDYTNK